MSSPPTVNIRFPQFAAALVATMRAKRITGRTVAAALHVREGTVSEWRTGLYRPDGERLEALARVLGVPVSELLGDDVAPNASPEPGVNIPPNLLAVLGYGEADPVAALVRQGQAEQAAWVLEFAARLFEAGAQRLRQGVQRDAIIQAVQATEAVVARQPPPPATTPPKTGRPPVTAGPARRPKSD